MGVSVLPLIRTDIQHWPLLSATLTESQAKLWYQEKWGLRTNVLPKGWHPLSSLPSLPAAVFALQ